jgi:Tfp pilus assembly protein PilF
MLRPFRLVPAIQLAPIAFVVLAQLAGCATSVSEPEDLQWRKARVHYDIGLEHLSRGRTALAIRELLQAKQLEPGDAWMSLALAEAYRRKGRLEEAETHLQRALEIDSEFQAAELNLAALYIQAERYEEAIVLLEPLKDDPTFPAPWRACTNLGWALYKLGRHAEARRELELAIDYAPDYWPALLDLGILEAQEGHRLAALGFFERVLQREPGARVEAEAHYRMAEIYISLGRRDQAIRHLSASRDRHPRSPWGTRSAEYLKILR